ncbi:MAG TPA: DUF1847 domain-containing protein [Ignavibacteriales bacterium]|nr:DUF1847 domain-containing protein [Ignavibacteriales bacterium]
MEKFSLPEIKEEYKKTDNQKILQAAARLVDYGRAGTLSRMEEIAEFIRMMNYKKPGLAYCYGMEQDAKLVRDFFKSRGIRLRTVSCTAGAMAQDELNENSCIHKVSCNPLAQAEELNAEEADFVIIMGICLGHDILLQKNLKADFTTLVVKDRVFNHQPLLALREN